MGIIWRACRRPLGKLFDSKASCLRAIVFVPIDVQHSVTGLRESTDVLYQNRFPIKNEPTNAARID